MMDLEQIEIGPHMKQSLMPVLMMVDVYWRIIHRRAEELVRILLGNSIRQELETWAEDRLRLVEHLANESCLGMIVFLILFWACLNSSSFKDAVFFSWSLVGMPEMSNTPCRKVTLSPTFGFQSGEKVMLRSGRRSTRRGPQVLL